MKMSRVLITALLLGTFSLAPAAAFAAPPPGQGQFGGGPGAGGPGGGGPGGPGMGGPGGPGRNEPPRRHSSSDDALKGAGIGLLLGVLIGSAASNNN